MESTDKNMSIFNAITELVASPEFHDDSAAFVQKNYAIFDEEEENKHEYKQVYEDYVSIMERTIEAKLKDENQFSEAEISGFLETFKDHMETYKA
jgi:hypothetical protein